jgi:Condensin II non structural maintenance of chromosomes subunit
MSSPNRQCQNILKTCDDQKTAMVHGKVVTARHTRQRHSTTTRNYRRQQTTCQDENPKSLQPHQQQPTATTDECESISQHFDIDDDINCTFEDNDDESCNDNKENHGCNHHTRRATENDNLPEETGLQRRIHEDLSRLSHTTTNASSKYDKKDIQEARRQILNSLVIGNDDGRLTPERNEIVTPSSQRRPLQQPQPRSDEENMNIDPSDEQMKEDSIHAKMLSLLSLLGPSVDKNSRTLYLYVIQYHWDKGNARNFFSNLVDVVEYMIQYNVTGTAYDDNVRNISSMLENEDIRKDNEMIVDNNDNDFASVTRRNKVQAFQFLIVVIDIVQTYLNGVIERQKQKDADKKMRRNSYVVDKEKSLMISVEVYEVALQLHNTLPYLTELLSRQNSNDQSHKVLLLSMQQNIITLCETWWKCNGNQREYLIVNVLPLLVEDLLDHGSSSRTTNDDGMSSKKSTKSKSNSSTTNKLIKRLYNIRTAIDALDFADEESDAFCLLLQRLVSLPICLNSTDGKNLLSYLMSTDAILIQKIHNAIRAQLPNNLRSTILKSYGDIYYGAWQMTVRQGNDNSSYDDGDDSSSVNVDIDMRSKFELIVLQDYMYAVIHVANTSIVKSLTILLESFYSNKKNQEVENMLYRMYNPIIWRSLKATNAIVRMNAVNVFAEVFPLVQHDIPVIDEDHKKELDQTQHRSFIMLLEDAIIQGCQSIQEIMIDPDHRVRTCGATATAKILVTYWDIIPTDHIRRFFNRKSISYVSMHTSSNDVTSLLICLVNILLSITGSSI